MMTGSSVEEHEVAPAAATEGSIEQPDWVMPELPPQYEEIARQIAALREQARAYEGVAGVLWQTGEALKSSVAELFTLLGFDVERLPDANYDLRVELGDDRRMLVEVVSEAQTLDRRSPHIGRVLRVLQEDAGARDRVVLAANVFPTLAPPARRDAPVAVDALRLIQGLGANVVPTSTLFGLWKGSLQDRDAARRSVMNLYAMDGGIFR